MNTIGATIPRVTVRTGVGETIDRWIYVFMASLFIAVVLAGFIPSSITKIAAVQAGRRPPFPLEMHAHAIVMGSWLLLLLAQTTLVATGKRVMHKQLGLVSLVLAPAVVASMVAVLLSTWSAVYSPEFPPVLAAQAHPRIANILLGQIQIITLFTTFVTWAIVVRKKDPQTHKRMLIFATLMALPAGIDRIPWLPHSLPDGFDSAYIYMLLLLTPVLIHDIVRRGRIHSAYVIGIAALVSCWAIVHSLWGTPWWQQTARGLMGV